MLSDYIDVFRPIRWYRNSTMLLGSVITVKVLNIPLHELLSTPKLITFFVTLVAICLVASGNYGINEVLDSETDSHHPEKQHRAIPSGRVPARRVIIISILLYAIGIGAVALLGNLGLLISVVLLFISGIAYNVKPFRLKDRPFVDFPSEALNNPIRFLIGWYAVASAHQLFPASFVLGYWFLGIFLMAAKRFGEIRLIKDKTTATQYRKSLGYYTEERLLMAMIAGATAFSYMMGALSFKYSVDVILVLPFVVGWMIWFFALAFEENTVVKSPERIFEKKGFIAYTLATVTIFTYCFYSGNQLLGWVK